MDVCGIFDSVNRVCLNDKMKALGITGGANTWVNGFPGKGLLVLDPDGTRRLRPTCQTAFPSDWYYDPDSFSYCSAPKQAKFANHAIFSLMSK